MTLSIVGHIPTVNASRYLQQLCKHWSHKLFVDFTPERGRVELPAGAIAILEAQMEALVVRLEAPDEEVLERMKEVLMKHLDRFAFREAPLEVAWQ